MRHYIVDPDKEDRLLKIPPSVVAGIQAEAEHEDKCNRQRAHREGYAAGLAAAREAVAGLRPWQYPDFACINYDAALAAIDGLRDSESAPYVNPVATTEQELSTEHDDWCIDQHCDGCWGGEA